MVPAPPPPPPLLQGWFEDRVEARHGLHSGKAWLQIPRAVTDRTVMPWAAPGERQTRVYRPFAEVGGL